MAAQGKTGTKPAKAPKHKWDFPAKFRIGAYPWNGTAKARANLKSALSELKAVAKKDPAVAAEGATRLVEKLVPSIERIDSSSGAIGSAVNEAGIQLAALIGAAHADPGHESRVERVFEAIQDDGYGYLDNFAESFATVCGTQELQSSWAEQLLSITRRAFSDVGGHFAGAPACISCLYHSGRQEELRELLSLRSFDYWPYSRYEAMGLAAQGKVDEALRFAHRFEVQHPYAIAAFCEQLLLDAGRTEEAYRNYGLHTRATNYLTTFRNLCKRYPQMDKARILLDLINSSPGEEGKWFAAARSIGELRLAVRLAQDGPCAPSTMMTAVKDLRAKHPEVAFELACAALRGMDLGWAYELDTSDYSRAKLAATELAEQLGRQDEVESLLRSFTGFLARFRAGG